jgi:hypothetical protein
MVLARTVTLVLLMTDALLVSAWLVNPRCAPAAILVRLLSVMSPRVSALLALVETSAMMETFAPVSVLVSLVSVSAPTPFAAPPKTLARLPLATPALVPAMWRTSMVLAMIVILVPTTTFAWRASAWEPFVRTVFLTV